MTRRPVTLASLALLLAGALLAATAPATAAATQPNCMQVYLGEYEAGPATVDASDSCVEVTVEASANAKPRCYQVYLGEYGVGPATVDASDTCVEVRVDEDWRPAATNACLAIFIEINAGPATYEYSCGGELTVDEDYNPATDDDNLPEFCTLNFQESVGPAAVSDTCGDGDAVQATVTLPADDTSPEDPEDVPKCVLTADDGTERFMCIFGPPGP